MGSPKKPCLVLRLLVVLAPLYLAEQAPAPPAIWTEDADIDLDSSEPEVYTAQSSKDKHVNRVINVAAALAALADGSLAQLPGTGAVSVAVIQAAMVFIIGGIHGCYIGRGVASSIAVRLATEHMQGATNTFLNSAFGMVPFLGNVAKASVSFASTKGIGNAANSGLKCGSTASLWDTVNDPINGGTAAKSEFASDDSFRDIGSDDSQWNTVVRSIGTMANEGFSGTGLQLLERFKSYTPWAEDEASILERVREASNGKELLRFLRMHSWNLVVVRATLDALKRLEAPDDCAGAEIVEAELWTVMSTQEAQSLAASYLLICRSRMGRRLWGKVVDTAGALLSSSGSRGFPATLLRDMLQIVSDCAEFSPDILPTQRLQSMFSNLLEVAKRSDVSSASCKALRSLVERKEIRGSVGVRQLEQVSNVKDSECGDALRADLRQCLQLAVLPEKALDERLSPEEGEEEMGPIVGQRCAVRRLMGSSGYLKMKQKRIWRRDLPLVLLFTGPAGTGKTMAASQFAEKLHGQPINVLTAQGKFKTFHMNQFNSAETQNTFFGPAQGIAGEGDLPEIVRRHPDAVILLDEVEKAHVSFARALLKVFGEHGVVYDPKTRRDLAATNVTFILTSNLAKDLIQAADVSQDGDCSKYEDLKTEVSNALAYPQVGGRDNIFFESEFQSRITEVLPFCAFTNADVSAAVAKFLNDEASYFLGAEEFLFCRLRWESEVVAHFSREYASQPEKGLRGVLKKITNEVRSLILQAINTELLQERGGVLLRLFAPLDASAARLDLLVAPPISQPGNGLSSSSSQFPDNHNRDGDSPQTYSPTKAAHVAVAAVRHAARKVQYMMQNQYVYEWNWDPIWEFLWAWRWMLLAGAMFLGLTVPQVQPILSASASAASYLAQAAPVATTAVSVAGLSVAWWYRHPIMLCMAGAVAVRLLWAVALFYGRWAARRQKRWQTMLQWQRYTLRVSESDRRRTRRDMKQSLRRLTEPERFFIGDAQNSQPSPEDIADVDALVRLVNRVGRMRSQQDE